jgi:uncharacterized membrane protein YfcA
MSKRTLDDERAHVTDAFTIREWLLVSASALGIGVSKAGFPGVSLIPVVVFALLFGARNSTGVVLPMLLIGDTCAVATFRQHARWDSLKRLLPAACVGVVIGAMLIPRLSDALYKPLIGWVILALAVLQLIRMARPGWLADVPHAPVFSWAMGLLAGCTTMLANAAGPVFAIYALAIGLPKFEFVGTTAWFFLLINLFKVPFSAGLGLIHGRTLLFNLELAPFIVLGVFVGRWLTARLPQRVFDAVLLVLAAAAAARLAW